MYNKEICLFENKSIGIYDKESWASDAKSGDYNLENKRTLKNFFKLFDNVNYFIVKHLEVDDYSETEPPAEDITSNNKAYIKLK